MRRASALTVLLTVAIFVGGCFERPLEGPPLGYETDEESCSDGRDNDGDGRVDCEDPNCLARNFCGEIIPILPVSGHEDSLEACIDGIDNDLDGQFDCGDRFCQQIQELCCVSEVDNETCSDGIDNDSNGFADCADFACRNGFFVSICDDGEVCADGMDNNGNGDIDCADIDCIWDSRCLGEVVCDDMMDDEGDGLTDCDDPECAESAGCQTPCVMGPEDTVETCSDGCSNDDDDFVDCMDFDCSRSANPDVAALCAGMMPEDTMAACTDNMDNDMDGFTDCDDFDCDEFCEMGTPEDTAATCSDGIDNDLNGFTDCDDFSCSRSLDPAIIAVCPTEVTFEECSDGLDNNNNGFIDCADFSCRVTFVGGGTNPDGSLALTLRSACLESGAFRNDIEREVAEFFDDNRAALAAGGIATLTQLRSAVAAAAVANCQDGNDNDADGFIDCEDWDCSRNPILGDLCATRICE